MTVFRLKQMASSSAHAAAGAIRWNYDRAEMIADGVVHGIGVFGGLVAATVLIVAIAGPYAGSSSTGTLCADISGGLGNVVFSLAPGTIFTV